MLSCVSQDTDPIGLGLDDRFMVIIENPCDRRFERSGVATLITGIWIVLGVLLFGY